MIIIFINLYCVYLTTKFSFWCLDNIKDDTQKIKYVLWNVFAALLNAGIAGHNVGIILGL